ncbi:hypothetical protein Bbelb_004480 [Branchiostoma belcheri]|nr:hypothetical protein Bbelb_004480 [Branchiostoma belcheri]
MSENIYSEACPVTPLGLAVSKTASVLNGDTVPPTVVNLVGVRNPGQSRVWTSAVKKTISVLSLVLNCSLLGVVIFLARKKWRDDLQCGPGFRTEDGYPAECNPDSSHPCCSPHNWCDVTPEHCDCLGCIDYRKRP